MTSGWQAGEYDVDVHVHCRLTYKTKGGPIQPLISSQDKSAADTNAQRRRPLGCLPDAQLWFHLFVLFGVLTTLRFVCLIVVNFVPRFGGTRILEGGPQ